ncbi:hypothetical protein SAMN06264364_11886 [Quadrisphaera granulorum]|uniref:Uncharacterized protein n=1 Tax=Quadrisphaera granulorum TaxID=317664 RepID=A0A316A7B8_9ACTN|nr:hypothetical protein BXY45_11886 [Quadrisphaera granulorum]SZE97536.1 hypothetical protein SAMN06264364_11886 [Quadrisphaera granulorum]
MLEERDCPWCAQRREFEVPPCSDGHGELCPELVCTTCSGALIVAGPPRPVVRRPRLAVVA